MENGSHSRDKLNRVEKKKTSRTKASVNSINRAEAAQKQKLRSSLQHLRPK